MISWLLNFIHFRQFFAISTFFKRSLECKLFIIRINRRRRIALYVFLNHKSYLGWPECIFLCISRHHQLFLKFWFSRKIMKTKPITLDDDWEWTQKTIWIFLVPMLCIQMPLKRFLQNRKSSYGNQLIDDFEKNLYFSEILDTTRNTMQKSVCRYLVPVSRKFWQKLIQIKKTDLRLR